MAKTLTRMAISKEMVVLSLWFCPVLAVFSAIMTHPYPTPWIKVQQIGLISAPSECERPDGVPRREDGTRQELGATFQKSVNLVPLLTGGGILLR